MKLLQINMNLSLPISEVEQRFEKAAPVFAAVDGLMWKYWCLNESENTGAGLYFFKDETSLRSRHTSNRIYTR